MWPCQRVGSLRPCLAFFAFLPLLLGSGLAQPTCSDSSCLPSVEDETSLLQMWTGMNMYSQPMEARPQRHLNDMSVDDMPVVELPEAVFTDASEELALQLPAQRNSMDMATSASLSAPDESSSLAVRAPSLAAARAGLDRRLQNDQGQASLEDPFSFSQSGSDASQQSSLQGSAALKKMVQELQLRVKVQADELRTALEQQQLSTKAMDHAKRQLQKQMLMTKEAWQAEDKAKKSELKALNQASMQALSSEGRQGQDAIQQEKEKALENRVQLATEALQQVEQQRQQERRELEKKVGIDKQVARLEQQAGKISETKALELAMLQVKDSEKKAWEVAKLQAEKAIAERRSKEKLLAEAKSELSSLKEDVSRVQVQAVKALKEEAQTEVERARTAANLKVEEVRKEANSELEKASGQLQREHDEVKSVVDWATKVQQEATAKLAWAKNAQEQAANQVSWANNAQREAAKAATAMERVAKAELKSHVPEEEDDARPGQYGWKDDAGTAQ